jgi:hypothetical protein
LPLIALALVAGCSAELSAELGGDGGIAVDGTAPPDAALGPASLVIVEPGPGAAFARNAVLAHDWVAAVPMRFEAVGLARIEVRYTDDTELAASDAAPFDLEVPVPDEGEVVLVAVGLDAGGLEVARDEVTVTVSPPSDPSCRAMLDALGLGWTAESPTQGIDDPIRLDPVIGGVTFRYLSSTDPTPMLMDCSLAPRLAELVALVAPYGIDEVIHLGIYNYRCIGGGDPDSGTCTPSQHAYAKAIDIHAFGLAGSDATFNTETDWVIREDLAEVCPGMPMGDADRVLHELACAMWAQSIFHIVLTPDYNDAHRNHFHVDLTDGSMFIGDTVSGVDPLIPHLGH